MSLFWKALAVLLLSAPVGAYATGAMVGSRNDLPDEPQPAVVDASSPSSTTPSRPAVPSESPTVDRGDDEHHDDDEGEDTDDSDGDEGDDDSDDDSEDDDDDSEDD